MCLKVGSFLSLKLKKLLTCNVDFLFGYLVNDIIGSVVGQFAHNMMILQGGGCLTYVACNDNNPLVWTLYYYFGYISELPVSSSCHLGNLCASDNTILVFRCGFKMDHSIDIVILDSYDMFVCYIFIGGLASTVTVYHLV